MQATIRTASAADLDGLLALYRHLHPAEAPPTPENVARAWSAMLNAAILRVFIAEAAGLLVATCALTIIPNLTRGARPYGLIENVVTHPGHRRTGLGRAVLAAALEAGWAAGCYKVALSTGSQRESTLRFYATSGFIRAGRTVFEARRP